MSQQSPDDAEVVIVGDAGTPDNLAIGRDW